MRLKQLCHKLFLTLYVPLVKKASGDAHTVHLVVPDVHLL
jgi:hypothetical protein